MYDQLKGNFGLKYLPIFILIFIANICLSQDVITTNDGKTIECKILEVRIETIRYKDASIPKGPVFEILKSDVRTIRYSNGHIEKYNTNSYDALAKDSTKNASIDCLSKKSDELLDTSKFAYIYFVYNSRSSDQWTFPIYINGQYICTLSNSSRLQYRIYSYGEIFIERKSKSYGYEPNTTICIESGKSYGINFLIVDPKKWSPNNIFDLVTITDSVEVKQFLDDVFYGFKPFKKSDFKLQEDINNPIIQ